jgi:1-acyl-sn-glycerol-3-phosphate acyltransferase
MKHIDEKVLDDRLHFIEQDKRYIQDPFGLSPQRFAQVFRILCPLYDEYFRVRTFGQEHIPSGALMLVSNHSGQLPFDGIMLTMSYFLHAPDPVIPRGMAERFLMRLPFLGKLTAETGGILGDRKNCQFVLNQKETVMVFPEGTRGINKSTKDFYQLKSFSMGFLRLCLQFKTPIVPVAIVGAEELYPLVVQAPWIAKLLKIPSMPITPLFPFTGLMGMIPLPSPIDIYYGETIHVNEKFSADDPDHVLKPEVERIQSIIQKMVQEGLKHKRPIWDEELKNNMKNYYEKFRERLKLVKEFLDQDKK